MTAEDFEQSMAALFAWREENDNCANAMLGILYVLRNRVEAGWHHGSWIENIAHAEEHHPGQKTVDAYPDVRDPAFLQVLQLVDEVYDGRRKDNLTGGALYWARPMKVDPKSWFATEIMNDPAKHPRTGSIGGTMFYGEVKDEVSG